MGEEKMTHYEFRKCVKARKIIPFQATKRLVNKEITAAEEDLAEAVRSVKDRSFKWATVQAYYAMFHAARSLIYTKGYREKSHYGLKVALEALFAKEGRIGKELIDNFSLAMELRESADYKSDFSEEGAEEVVNYAREFLKIAKAIL